MRSATIRRMLTLGLGFAVLYGTGTAQSNLGPTTVWMRGATVLAAPNGNFILSVLLGPDNTTFGRVRGVIVQDNGTSLFGASEFFDLVGNQAFLVQDLVFFPDPIPGILGLRLEPQNPVLTFVGEQTQLDVFADLSNGTTENVFLRAQGTEYSSSNPSVAAVDLDGLVTAFSEGEVTFSAKNEGALATALVTVQVPTGLTDVVGFVTNEIGAPELGVDVTVFADTIFTTTTDGVGAFTVTGVGTATAISVVARSGSRVASAANLAPIPDGLTDAGIMALQPRAVALYPTVTRPINFGAIALDVGDFNRDSFMDVTVVDNNNQVWISRGNGNTVFTVADLSKMNTGGAAAKDVLAVDLDGLLGPDLVVLSSGSADATVWLNNGDGTFGAPSTIPVGLTPVTMVAADLDGDGDLDLAVGDESLNAVFVLLNDGAGALSMAGGFPAGTAIVDIAAGDVDGDLDIDLAAVARDSDEISVLLNDGNAVFTVFGFNSTGGGSSEPTGIALVDVDGDLDLDLAVTVDETTGIDNVLVFTNAGNGSYGAGVPFALGTDVDPTAVEGGDVDGDLNADLLVASPGIRALSLLTGNGLGSFAAPVDFLVGDGAVDFALADMDGDMVLDLVPSSRFSLSFSVLLNLGAGVFEEPGTLAVGMTPVDVLSATIDADAFLDLAVVNEDTDEVTIHPGIGDGTFGPLSSVPVGGPTSAPKVAALGDFDGDLDLDLAVVLDDNTVGLDTIEIFSNDGAGGFTLTASLVPGEVGLSIQAADLSGDGVLDLVVMNNPIVPPLAGVTVFINNGVGTFAPGVFYPTFVSAFSGGTLVTGDIDGDLDLDLIVTAGSDSITLLFNAGDGTFLVTTTLLVDPSSTFVGVAAQDLDGDSDLDIAVVTANPFAGFDGLRIFSNDGTGFFTLTESHLFGVSPTALVIAEVTGDSFPDIVVSAGGFDTLEIFIGDGTGTFTHPTGYLAQNGPGALTAGDFNGDLATDLAATGQEDVVTVHLHK